MRTSLKLVLVLAALGALLATPAVAAAASHGMHGVVPHRGAPEPFGRLGSDPSSMAGTNLSYHNGDVMRTNKTYAIYWVPSGYSVSANYRTLIDGFLANVAADSGKNTNVYASDAQYYDTVSGGGSAAYSSTFGGSVVATNAFPANGCTLSSASAAKCLSDAQLASEISTVITAQGWPRGKSTAYFILTPIGVGSCYDAFNCSDNAFCAYHSWSGSGSTEVIYANQPYAAVPGCDPGQSPNGDDADATINVLSHEHNEAVTDPASGGWWDDLTGDENGDKCAWTFGSALGTTAFGQYNQVIGTGKYYLQREWSNASSSCVLTMPVPTPAPTLSSFAPTSGPVGTSVTLTGTNFTGATSVTLRNVSATFAVNSATSITATVPATGYPDGRWRVTTPGGTATSAGSFMTTAAAQPPTISGFSPGSGGVGATVTITGTRFTGATSVKLGTFAASFTVGSATSISAKVPAGATSARWSVTTPGGTATSTGTFTVASAVAAPTITSFTPGSGPVGSTVTITGTNFTGATSVTLRNIGATSFTVVSPTQITATVPATGAPDGRWRVTTAGGTAVSAAAFYTT